MTRTVRPCVTTLHNLHAHSNPPTITDARSPFPPTHPHPPTCVKEVGSKRKLKASTSLAAAPCCRSVLPCAWKVERMTLIIRFTRFAPMSCVWWWCGVWG